MDRRERLMGIAEKLPKRMLQSAELTEPAPRRKVVALAAQPLRKRR
jgi:hypothetical protein